ncbi:MAG TPA: caspase family protein, partial [Ferruginibacter sp.]|nr:caspase family protein [Ferruginibacter sp.]
MALQGFIKSRAYLVGIDEYAAPVRKLHTAVNDVKAIASCLPDFDNIAPPFQNPTVEDFKKILGRIIEEVNDEANPADRVFIYFAGHGKVVYNKENTPKGYLL